MSDLISRQAAIHAVCERECTELEPCKGGCEAIWALQDLPSVEKTGKWTRESVPSTMGYYRYRCNVCDWTVEEVPKCCSHCGMRMEENNE